MPHVAVRASRRRLSRRYLDEDVGFLRVYEMDVGTFFAENLEGGEVAVGPVNADHVEGGSGL
jgi:hypothetical protein